MGTSSSANYLGDSDNLKSMSSLIIGKMDYFWVLPKPCAECHFFFLARHFGDHRKVGEFHDYCCFVESTGLLKFFIVTTNWNFAGKCGKFQGIEMDGSVFSCLLLELKAVESLCQRLTLTLGLECPLPASMHQPQRIAGQVCQSSAQHYIHEGTVGSNSEELVA